MRPLGRNRRGWRMTEGVVEMRSAAPGACFIATLTGQWRPIGKVKHTDAEINTAMHGYLTVTCEAVTRQRFVTQPLAAQALANASLCQRVPLPYLSIEVFGKVSLKVDRGDLAITEEHLAAQRLPAANDQQAAPTSNPTSVDLRSIFTSEAAAKLWWADRHPDKLDAVRDGTIANLVEVVRAEDEARSLGAEDNDSLVRVFADLVKRFDTADDLPPLMAAFLEYLKLAKEADLESRVQKIQNGIRSNGEEEDSAAT